MKIAIVEYGSGNTRSVLCALSRLGYEATLTDNPKILNSSDRIIFPGVGEARSAMQKLKSTGLDQELKKMDKPFLGICLGLQLMASSSQENNTECLDIFKADAVKFMGKKVPHMGWNTIDTGENPDPIFKAFKGRKLWFYFVHSYYVKVCENTIATCNYENTDFSAACRKDNFLGLQFHPEKSSVIGQQILRTFIEEGV